MDSFKSNDHFHGGISLIMSLKSRIDKNDLEVIKLYGIDLTAKTPKNGQRNKNTMSMSQRLPKFERPKEKFSSRMSVASTSSFGDSTFSHMSSTVPLTGIKAIDDLRAAKSEITPADGRSVLATMRNQEERKLKK